MNESTGDEPPPVGSDVNPYFVIFLTIIGTIGNLLVCQAIYLDKKLRTLTNLFLLSLAMADLLIGGLILPARLLSYIYYLRPADFVWCYIYLVADDYLTVASALHICVISLERYLAIKNPIESRNLTKKRTYIKICFVWSMSFLFIIPYLTLAILSHTTGKFPGTPQYCPILLNYFIFGEVVVVMELFIICVMIFFVVYSFIGTMYLLRKYYAIQNPAQRNNSTGLIRTIGGLRSKNIEKNVKTSNNEMNSEKKAMKVIWLVSFAFVIAMAPYGAVIIINFTYPKVLSTFPFIVKTGSYLNYANSVINPIIYTIFNKRFRDNFKNIIIFRYKEK